MTKIHSKALHRALQIVAPAVSSKPVIPILSNVKFENGFVYATDTFLDISTKSGLPDDFSAIIPFDELRAITGVLNSDMEISISGNSCNIKSQSGKWKLALPADNVWPNPETVPNTWHDVPDGFTDAIFSAAKMTQVTEAVPLKSNVLIYQQRYAMRVGGFDNIRFHEVAFPPIPGYTALIPTSITRALAGLQPTEFAITERAIHFKSGDLSISCRLAEGSIPDFGIFTPSRTANITAKRGELLAAIQQVTVLKRSLTDSLELSFTPGNIGLKYESFEGGNVASIEVAGECEGAGSVVVNASFMADLLNCLESDEVGLLYTEQSKPLHIFDIGRDGVLALIMPIMPTAKG